MTLEKSCCSCLLSKSCPLKKKNHVCISWRPIPENLNKINKEEVSEDLKRILESLDKILVTLNTLNKG